MKTVNTKAPEHYYCQMCNRNILAPYGLDKCPDCGEKLMNVEYRIIQDNNSGKYEVKVSKATIK